jgi:hypothetical protein
MARQNFSTSAPYRIAASPEGHFAVLHNCGAAVDVFRSRREAAAYIEGRVAEDKIFQAAKQLIGIATDGLMRRHDIDRVTARFWIREAADSGN